MSDSKIELSTEHKRFSVSDKPLTDRERSALVQQTARLNAVTTPPPAAQPCICGHPRDGEFGHDVEGAGNCGGNIGTCPCTKYVPVSSQPGEVMQIADFDTRFCPDCGREDGITVEGAQNLCDTCGATTYFLGRPREVGGPHDAEFVLSIEEFDNGFVAHGLMGLVASDRTRDGAIEKLRRLTIRQVDSPEHKSGLLSDLERIQASYCSGQQTFQNKMEAIPSPPETTQNWDERYRTMPAVKCACGMKEVPAAIDGVQWYWQSHSRTGCTLELPNLVCWCGLKRSEHITGHADGVPKVAEPAAQVGAVELPALETTEADTARLRADNAKTNYQGRRLALMYYVRERQLRAALEDKAASLQREAELRANAGTDEKVMLRILAALDAANVPVSVAGEGHSKLLTTPLRVEWLARELSEAKRELAEVRETMEEWKQTAGRFRDELASLRAEMGK